MEPRQPGCGVHNRIYYFHSIANFEKRAILDFLPGGVVVTEGQVATALPVLPIDLSQAQSKCTMETAK